MSNQVHSLKTWPEYYRAVREGGKTFECRKDDRDFKVGDFVDLHEYDPETGYTGEATAREITYILRDFEGVTAGWVVMGIK